MKNRIVITGVGLTSPLGNNINELRTGLLEGKSGIQISDVRHMGPKPAGLCNFEQTKYMSRKMVKRGTRAGSIAVYCANEALGDAGLKIEDLDKDRVGTYVGITEHGNVETENEIHELYQNELDTTLWSHHHNPRTVANNPAGEVTLNLGLTGPHYTIGAACAAGNLGVIQGLQMLQLGEVDYAICGGVSESPQTFGIFAAFAAQGALGIHENVELSTRPLDKDRNGIVISEGGCLYILERLEDAQKRGAKIYAEIIGHHSNSDASDFVLPNTERQIECMKMAIKRAEITSDQVDIVSMHATGTVMGDIQECEAVKTVFSGSKNTKVNGAKGHIGHCMGAAGALELAGNLMSFQDNKVHGCRNIENIDPKCDFENLVKNEPIEKEVNVILNNSFGMLGINSSLIVKKYKS